ncbi:hypothetical protein K1T71_007831 [Dendrolimus kikuchii]|uniref:Uncharacterized protein n=1 Tax=Dendrolimus kikuchii TaxID=765133 RepID=A0ACC1CZE2_9NEOP|nr:hypothetical protein K1T71_007831 [Dendrolimus kikuchii]
MEIVQINDYVMNITEENVKQILYKLENNNEKAFVNYSIRKASDKMLGFLADYFRLEIHTVHNNIFYLFIKAISRSNLAKATMMRELRSFEKETYFYSVIKKKMEISGLRPWSAKFITFLEDAIVFEDLNALQYKLRNKFQRFDVPHSLQALKALARFHASSILYEEKRKEEVKPKMYTLADDFPLLSEKSGFKVTSPWFQQCMKGALEAIRTFSNYDDHMMARIENCWADIWTDAMSLSSSSKLRMVICHKDLWNNNVLFHYREDVEHNFEPDDCVFVDFAAYKYEPPASDVMLLLYCNLEPKMREENMSVFLNYYYEELAGILLNHGTSLETIITKGEFFKSAKEYRKYAAVVCSCLMPQFWIDDDLLTNIFSHTEKFNEILLQNKVAFIKTMMENSHNYKKSVMEIFEEIVERYCH